MPKRTIDERICEFNRKIEELQQKKNSGLRNKRIRIIYSSSDEDNDQDTDNIPCTSHVEIRPQHDQSPTPMPNDAFDPNICEYQEAEPQITEMPQEVPIPNEAASPSADVQVEPELLMALGESTDDTPEFGKAIHESLASLWLPLLKKGLAKENKEKLIKNYLIPENCKLLQSPKLNAETSAAVSEIVRGRDKKLSGFQEQLGAGITALNKGMEILLSSDNKAKALTHLSDSCRILTDLHYASTKDRIKLLTPSLDENILHVIQDSERDDTLFGDALSEKIKASKAIVRQGQQIKKTVTNQPSTSGYRQPTPSRYTPQGNWRGPPRYYASSRGGRGNQTRTAPTRRPYTYNTYSAATPIAKAAHQTRPRAPTQQ